MLVLGLEMWVCLRLVDNRVRQVRSCTSTLVANHNEPQLHHLRYDLSSPEEPNLESKFPSTKQLYHLITKTQKAEPNTTESENRELSHIET